jgi:Uma2 family endonuclease
MRHSALQRRTVVTATTAQHDTRLISGEELAHMGDIGPCELVRGRIVPTLYLTDEQAGIEATIASELRAFVRTHNLGKVRGGEAGIYTSRNPDTVRGADVLFISHERYTQKQSCSYLDVAPDLIVEILLPSNTREELREKVQEYFAIGVRMVWVVNPRRRTIAVYRSPTDVRELHDDETIAGEEVLPGFACPVATLLED